MINIPGFLNRKIIFFLVLFIPTSAFSQQPTFTKYFDSLWSPVASAEVAYFMTTFYKVGNLFEVKSYWVKSKKLNIKSTYADTSFLEPRGIQIRYFENGNVQDSIQYDNTGKALEFYRFYQSGKLLVYSGYNTKTNKDFSEAYKENGNIIPGYIFQREASFPSGNDGWIKYLTKNLNRKVPVKNNAPKGLYQIIVTFIVGKEGQIVDVNTLNDPGYGMKEEVIRVITNSPNWTPCILENKPINAYRRQPITFTVL